VTLSIPARRAIMASETGEVFLLLLTLSHRLLTPPLRFANNTTPITSRSNVYAACPFEVSLPDERDDQVAAQIQLRIDNVNRQIMEGIRQLPIGEPPTAVLELILASSPDVVEQAFPDFTLREVEYDALIVSGTLAVEDMLNERYPQYEFTPAWFPALFASAT
jgi:hypothetical protein